MKPLTTTTQVLDALGGCGAVSRKLNAGYKAVCSWRVKNKFPAYTYLALRELLAREKLTAPDRLWAMHYVRAKRTRRNAVDKNRNRSIQTALL